MSGTGGGAVAAAVDAIIIFTYSAIRLSMVSSAVHIANRTTLNDIRCTRETTLNSRLNARKACMCVCFQLNGKLPMTTTESSQASLITATCDVVGSAVCYDICSR